MLCNPDPEPRSIQITLNGVEKTLTFCDNGIGCSSPVRMHTLGSKQEAPAQDTDLHDGPISFGRYMKGTLSRYGVGTKNACKALGETFVTSSKTRNMRSLVHIVRELDEDDFKVNLVTRSLRDGEEAAASFCKIEVHKFRFDEFFCRDGAVSFQVLEQFLTNLRAMYYLCVQRENSGSNRLVDHVLNHWHRSCMMKPARSGRVPKAVERFKSDMEKVKEAMERYKMEDTNDHITIEFRVIFETSAAPHVYRLSDSTCCLDQMLGSHPKDFFPIYVEVELESKKRSIVTGAVFYFPRLREMETVPAVDEVVGQSSGNKRRFMTFWMGRWLTEEHFVPNFMKFPREKPLKAPERCYDRTFGVMFVDRGIEPGADKTMFRKNGKCLNNLISALESEQLRQTYDLWLKECHLKYDAEVSFEGENPQYIKAQDVSEHDKVVFCDETFSLGQLVKVYKEIGGKNNASEEHVGTIKRLLQDDHFIKNNCSGEVEIIELASNNSYTEKRYKIPAFSMSTITDDQLEAVKSQNEESIVRKVIPELRNERFEAGSSIEFPKLIFKNSKNTNISNNSAMVEVTVTGSKNFKDAFNMPIAKPGWPTEVLNKFSRIADLYTFEVKPKSGQSFSSVPLNFKIVPTKMNDVFLYPRTSTIYQTIGKACSYELRIEDEYQNNILLLGRVHRLDVVVDETQAQMLSLTFNPSFGESVVSISDLCVNRALVGSYRARIIITHTRTGHRVENEICMQVQHGTPYFIQLQGPATEFINYGDFDADVDIRDASSNVCEGSTQRNLYLTSPDLLFANRASWEKKEVRMGACELQPSCMSRLFKCARAPRSSNLKASKQKDPIVNEQLMNRWRETTSKQATPIGVFHNDHGFFQEGDFILLETKEILRKGDHRKTYPKLTLYARISSVLNQTEITTAKPETAIRATYFELEKTPKRLKLLRAGEELAYTMSQHQEREARIVTEHDEQISNLQLEVTDEANQSCKENLIVSTKLMVECSWDEQGLQVNSNALDEPVVLPSLHVERNSKQTISVHVRDGDNDTRLCKYSLNVLVRAGAPKMLRLSLIDTLTVTVGELFELRGEIVDGVGNPIDSSENVDVRLVSVIPLSFEYDQVQDDQAEGKVVMYDSGSVVVKDQDVLSYMKVTGSQVRGIRARLLSRPAKGSLKLGLQVKVDKDLQVYDLAPIPLDVHPLIGKPEKICVEPAQATFCMSVDSKSQHPCDVTFIVADAAGNNLSESSDGDLYMKIRLEAVKLVKVSDPLIGTCFKLRKVPPLSAGEHNAEIRCTGKITAYNFKVIANTCNHVMNIAMKIQEEQRHLEYRDDETIGRAQFLATIEFHTEDKRGLEMQNERPDVKLYIEDRVVEMKYGSFEGNSLQISFTLFRVGNFEVHAVFTDTRASYAGAESIRSSGCGVKVWAGAVEQLKMELVPSLPSHRLQWSYDVQACDRGGNASDFHPIRDWKVSVLPKLNKDANFRITAETVALGASVSKGTGGFSLIRQRRAQRPAPSCNVKFRLNSNIPLKPISDFTLKIPPPDPEISDDGDANVVEEEDDGMETGLNDGKGDLELGDARRREEEMERAALEMRVKLSGLYSTMSNAMENLPKADLLCAEIRSFYAPPPSAQDPEVDKYCEKMLAHVAVIKETVQREKSKVESDSNRLHNKMALSNVRLFRECKALGCVSTLYLIDHVRSSDIQTALSTAYGEDLDCVVFQTVSDCNSQLDRICNDSKCKTIAVASLDSLSHVLQADRVPEALGRASEFIRLEKRHDAATEEKLCMLAEHLFSDLIIFEKLEQATRYYQRAARRGDMMVGLDAPNKVLMWNGRRKVSNRKSTHTRLGLLDLLRCSRYSTLKQQEHDLMRIEKKMQARAEEAARISPDLVLSPQVIRDTFIEISELESKLKTPGSPPTAGSKIMPSNVTNTPSSAMTPLTSKKTPSKRKKERQEEQEPEALPRQLRMKPRRLIGERND
ncbi:hypothetical protein GUITHDRAFT_141368 [Guillardia theta CCMP2712]|uniref:SMCHD1 ribosomal S5 domain-containing protein n=1 Tax=Guillardia theta (strain CCMP2712) TaxID=905079 RepID=L1J0U8_GUITC|nr:hypothetical protein GUITHDRAFT_141368 [Guillardia theta CCMP2712]EKX42153.1 hypothetical protein GUITHDRAFT_141368 [Guillardia theta CCMP2712]|eukprot:XP_005829133.1 hypothetical protein GUITHDRAFT_141368 [Guillardia theta CCMP2712]